MTEIVVCGFFKADGVDRALPLRRRLDGLRTRYDFVAIDIRGSPDAYALSKPLQVGAAMDRHPGKTILFIDLACRIVGTRDDLLRAAEIPGDIAFHVRTRLCSQGKPALAPHAETLVLRPTARAHVFVRTWIETWERAAGIGSAFFYRGRLFPNTEFGHIELLGDDAEKLAAASVRTRQHLDWPTWAARLNRYLEEMEKLVSPDLIVLGGGVSENYSLFRPYLDTRARIECAALGNNAGILGAALAVDLPV